MSIRERLSQGDLAGALYSALHGVRPSAVAARLGGPRVLLNGLPRAGAHVLARALMRFPGLRSAGAAGRDSGESFQLQETDEELAATARALRRLRRGQFAVAHLPAAQPLLEVVVQRELRVFVLVRDPRDLMLSQAAALATPSIEESEARRAFRRLSERERLEALLSGMAGVAPPLETVLRRYEAWVRCPNALVLRFEDLVGAQGGGTNGVRNVVLARMLEFLGLRGEPALIRRIAAGMYPPGVRFRPAVGRWRQHFDDALLADYRGRAGDAARVLGYD